MQVSVWFIVMIIVFYEYDKKVFTCLPLLLTLTVELVISLRKDIYKLSVEVNHID